VAAWQDLGGSEQLVAHAAFTVTGLVRAGHAAADLEKRTTHIMILKKKLLAEKKYSLLKTTGVCMGG
jgi:hypothetical protein